MSRKKLLKNDNIKDFIPVTIGDRINFFVASSGLTGGKFCKLMDISSGNLNGLINDDSQPSTKFLCRILDQFNLNVNWLLTGQGQMLCGPEVVLTDDALKIGGWDEDVGLLTDKGDQYREHGQSARTSLEARSKEQSEGLSSLYNDMEKDPEAADLLTKTWQIIKSNTGYSASLAANIRSFHQAMTTESRLNGMESQMQDLVDVCRDIKERLKKSDSSLRQEDPEEIRGEILKKRAV